jgi:SecY interacting protein Syd
MDHDVSHALREFTQRYVDEWQQQYGHAPASQELYGVASPCIVENRDDTVLWLPQTFTPAASLEKVEQALELRLQPDIHTFYTQQYAGDMSAQFGEHSLTL